MKYVIFGIIIIAVISTYLFVGMFGEAETETLVASGTVMLIGPPLALYPDCRIITIDDSAYMIIVDKKRILIGDYCEIWITADKTMFLR